MEEGRRDRGRQQILDLSAIIIVAVCSFLAFSFGIQFYDNAALPPPATSDVISYLDAAELWYHHGMVHPTRPMVFPFLLGIQHLWGGDTGAMAKTAQVINLASWLATVALIYLTVFSIAERGAAITASILYSVNIGSIAICSRALSEPVFTALLVFFVWATCRYITKRSPWALSGSASALCLSTLVRPIILPVVLLIAGGALWALIARRAYVPALCVVAAILGIGIQVLMEHHQYDTADISNIGPVTYYLYLGAYTSGTTGDGGGNDATGTWIKERDHRLSELPRLPDGSEDWPSVRRLAGQDLLDQATSRPAAMMRVYLRNIATNSSSSSYIVYSARDLKGSRSFAFLKPMALALTKIQNIAYSAVILLLLPGSVVLALLGLLPRSKLAFVAVPAMVGLYIVLASGISFAQGDRLHLPAVPMALIGLLAAISAKHVKS